MIASAKPKKPWIVGSLREVAEFFGIAYSTAKSDWVPAGMPGAPKAYDLSEIYLWRKARELSQRRGTAGQSLEDQAMLETIRFKRLKNDKMEGELVRRDEAEQSAAELIARVKQRFESVPDELEVEFPSENRAYLKQRIEDKVWLILTEMSKWEIGDGE